MSNSFLGEPEGSYKNKGVAEAPQAVSTLHIPAVGAEGRLGFGGGPRPPHSPPAHGCQGVAEPGSEPLGGDSMII